MYFTLYFYEVANAIYYCNKWPFFLSSVVGHDVSIMSPGQRFMTDLLVSSLMADGGLESALEAAIKNEISEIEGKKVS